MTTSDWSIKHFHSKAWHVVKTYKELWLLGFAVLVFSGGSMNFSNSFDNFSQYDQEQFQDVEAQTRPATDPELDPLYRLDEELESQEAIDQKLELEYGLSDEELQAEESAFGEFFMETLSRVQPVGWLMTVISIIGYVIIGFMTYVVGTSWSQAALILGVADAAEDKKPVIGKASVQGLHYVKTVFLVGLLPWLMFAVAFGVVSVLATIFGAIMQNFWFGLILGIAVVIAVVIGFILVTTTVVLGTREGVLHSTGTRKAISVGWRMAKLHWRKAFSLFFRNGLIEALVMIGLFAPGIIAMIDPVSKFNTESAMLDSSIWGSFMPAIFLFFAAAMAYFFFKSVYNVFTFTTWHLAHSVLRKSTPTLQRA